MFFLQWAEDDSVECRSELLHCGRLAVRLPIATQGDARRPVFVIGEILFQK
jgi:hypothetical protein